MIPALATELQDLIARWRDQLVLEEIVDALEDAVEELVEEINERD